MLVHFALHPAPARKTINSSRIETEFFEEERRHLAVGISIYVASLPKSDASGGFVCAYDSDATYRTVVGARGRGCCGSVINWGVTSAYKKCQVLICTQQVCPN